MPDRVPVAVPLTLKSRQPVDAAGRDAPSVLSYFALRRAAGYIGLLLPLITAAWHTAPFTKLGCMPSSISGSYYTGTRNYFVGSLCGVGVFLVCSIGYPEDVFWSIFAGVMALLVAFCPTAPDKLCSLEGQSEPFGASHTIHTVAACFLFATFAFFCLCLFTRTGSQPGYMPRLAGLPRQKKKRNQTFIACGCTMLLAMGTQAAFALIPSLRPHTPRHLLFGVEWVCLWSFGIAWLVKGQQLFKDTETLPGKQS